MNLQELSENYQDILTNFQNNIIKKVKNIDTENLNDVSLEVGQQISNVMSLESKISEIEEKLDTLLDLLQLKNQVENLVNPQKITIESQETEDFDNEDNDF